MKIVYLTFCLMGFLIDKTLAQVEAKPVPGRMPMPSLPSPVTLADAAKNDSADPEMVSPDTIQFPNNPVSDFLVIYEKLKGVTLIKDASLLAGGANLSLTLNQPVTKAEAIRLLESTLLLNGYAFIAVDEKAIKVINTLGGKNPRSEGVFLFTDEKSLPEGEVIASYVMPLTYLSAADAVPIFEQFITLHPYGSLVPVPIANQVLITENSTLIRRLIDVRQLVDQPAPEVKREFVQLHQADADRVVELITKLFEDRKSSTGSGGTAKAATGQPSQPPGVPVIPGASATGGATITSGESGADILLIPDTRTNRILISARPTDIAYIKKLIADFDIAVDLSEPYEYPLNYVAASDMLPILSDLLQEQSDEGTGAAGGATGQPTRAVSGGIGSNLANAANSARTGSSSGGVSGAGQLGSLQEPGEQQAAQSIIVGKTRLIADNRANSILVIGQPEAKTKVMSILGKLDKRPLQVYLATVIGQLRVSNADDFSVNILQKYAGGTTGAASIAGGRNFTSTNTPLSGTAANMAAMANVAQAALGGLPGVQIMTFIGNSLNLYIQALTATARFRIASRPAIFTANNKKAVIYNGQKIAVPTSTVTTLGGGGSATATSGSQQSNIQYQDVVLKIEVVPLINSAREISLQIIQTNDTLEKGINSSADIGGGVSVPKINTQELTTSVIVPDRATILLGGLVTQTDEKSSSGVPFLSTIPLMGNLFKSTTDTTDRQELVVMMQPSVIGDTPELKEISRTERDLTGFSSKELAPVSKNMGGKLPPNASASPTLNADPQANKRSWDTLWSKNSQE
ncbi:MAG: hypothetical protein EBT69_06665 [Verrucomicrobia bacterium]|nr:hypothetical protein [Verrucomicrobiota bacterium]